MIKLLQKQNGAVIYASQCSRPFEQLLRRHPLAHLPIIDDHVDKMIKAGVVSPTVSEWASNVYSSGNRTKHGGSAST